MKKPSVKPAVASEAGGFDLAVVAGLAKIAAANDLSEVEVEREGMRIRVARERHTIAATHVLAAPPGAVAAAPMMAAPPNLLAAETAIDAVDNPGTVKSPMVGTAYLRPSPDIKPFVEIGDSVKSGDKLLLVEAMKTFNEIVAPKAGKVTQILIEDGAPVEYGQALMVIE
jgi:acetyl-CoA carboxylase biotin carboxyl carrier protein